jgi:hypothetical protein
MLGIIFKLSHDLFDLCQVSLCKMAKHWDSFLSDCSPSVLHTLIIVLEGMHSHSSLLPAGS